MVSKTVTIEAPNGMHARPVSALVALVKASGQQVTHQVRIPSQSLEILPFSLRLSRAREHQRDQVGDVVHLSQKCVGHAVRQVERHPVVTPAAVALH